MIEGLIGFVLGVAASALVAWLASKRVSYEEWKRTFCKDGGLRFWVQDMPEFTLHEEGKEITFRKENVYGGWAGWRPCPRKCDFVEGEWHCRQQARVSFVAFCNSGWRSMLHYIRYSFPSADQQVGTISYMVVPTLDKKAGQLQGQELMAIRGVKSIHGSKVKEVADTVSKAAESEVEALRGDDESPKSAAPAPYEQESPDSHLAAPRTQNGEPQP